MLFVDDSTDLNTATFNESTGFHVLSEFGPPRDYMKRLQSKIRGSMYHGVEMNRDRIGADLESALNFQKCYAQNVCATLESHFVDNGIIGAFKILNPSNMPTTQVGLGSWGVLELDVLCSH